MARLALAPAALTRHPTLAAGTFRAAPFTPYWSKIRASQPGCRDWRPAEPRPPSRCRLDQARVISVLRKSPPTASSGRAATRAMA
jgi:hypothetical protein